MGCWSETCGLSQNTINVGEDVYAVIILNNSNIEKSCYATGISTPITFVIKGKYNDYGSIENVVDDFSCKSTIALFNEYLKTDKLILDDSFYKDTIGQYSDYALKDGKFVNIESIFYAIERNYMSLRTNSYFGDEKQQSISFMLILKDVLDSMWDTVNYSNDYEMKNSSWEICKDDIQVYFDNSMSSNSDNPYMDKLGIREALKKEGITEEEEDELYELLFAFSNRMKPWGGGNLKSNHNNWGNMMRILTDYNSVNIESFKILDTITKELYTDDNSEEIKQSISEFLMLLNVMSAFRKVWYPQGHSSQHDSFDMVIDYTERLLRKLYIKRQANYEEYGGYEDGFPQVVGAVPIFEEGKMK
jgi:hypothetical protein